MDEEMERLFEEANNSFVQKADDLEKELEARQPKEDFVDDPEQEGLPTELIPESNATPEEDEESDG